MPSSRAVRLVALRSSGSAGVQLSGIEHGTNPAVEGAVVLLRVSLRPDQTLLAAFLVPVPLDAPLVVEHIGGAAVARSQVGPHAEPADHLGEPLDHGAAGAHVQDGGGAAPHRRPHAELALDVRARRLPHTLGPAPHGAVGQEVHAEVVRLAGVVQHDVTGVGARVNVAVDEARADEPAAGVDGAVHRPVETVAHVHDAVILIDHHALGQEFMAAAVMAHHPAALNECLHVFSPRDLSRCAVLERRAGCQTLRPASAFSTMPARWERMDFRRR